MFYIARTLPHFVSWIISLCVGMGPKYKNADQDKAAGKGSRVHCQRQRESGIFDKYKREEQAQEMAEHHNDEEGDRERMMLVTTYQTRKDPHD